MYLNKFKTYPFFVFERRRQGVGSQNDRWAINKERAGIFREAENNQSSNETNIPISQTCSLISLQHNRNVK